MAFKRPTIEDQERMLVGLVRLVEHQWKNDSMENESKVVDA